MKRSIDGTVHRAAARLEEEAPQFRSAAVQVARPPSLAQRGGIGGGVGLDRVPGDYVGAAAAAASAAVRPSPLEEPKDDIRKLLAAETREDSKPAAAAAAAGAAAAAAPSAESNWAIAGGSASLRSVPTYYPLEKSSRCVSLGGNGGVEDLAARISDCCRIMSVHAEYEGGGDVPVSSDGYLDSNIKEACCACLAPDTSELELLELYGWSIL